MQPKTIDFAYILGELKGIVEENQQENLMQIEQENTKSHEKKPVAAYEMLDFQYNKMVCLNFLQYCLENRDTLQLDLEMFTEADQEEIQRYIKNNLYIALSSHNPPPKSDYLEQQNRYKTFLSNIHPIQNGYALSTPRGNYVLPVNHFEKVVFCHNYGLTELPMQVQEELAGKDFIDAGAYIGDTALMLNQYKPRRIYAFEPSQINLALMQKTLQLNNAANVEPVPYAVGEEESTAAMVTWDNASYLSSSGTQKVKVTSIDKFQKTNNLNVGLIKMDIEGAEYRAILGAKNTITTQKPVLLISLYHRGQDFFETPKILKEYVPSYKFRFLNLHKLAPILEKVLVAYVDA